VNEVNGGLAATGDAIWVGNGGSTTTSYAGLRFTNVTIPTGVTIISARLELYSAQDQWIGISLATRGDKVATSAPFTSGNLPSQRNLTTATINHTSNTRWSANTWYPLDEIAAVVQEIVGSSGWQSGNSLSIILRGNGSAIWGRKFARSREAGPATAPRLVITYSGGTP
jgi:hypothetical protein